MNTMKRVVIGVIVALFSGDWSNSGSLFCRQSGKKGV